MDAIDLDPASNSRETSNEPTARHYPAQDNGLLQSWEGRIHRQTAVMAESPGYD